MKKFALFGLLAIILLMSCKDDEVMTPETSVTATLSGKVEGTFNESTKMLMFNITYTGFTPVAWHIHKAAAAANGGVIFNMGTTFTSLSCLCKH
jgi:hypothetical protein